MLFRRSFAEFYRQFFFFVGTIVCYLYFDFYFFSCLIVFEYFLHIFHGGDIFSVKFGQDITFLDPCFFCCGTLCYFCDIDSVWHIIGIGYVIRDICMIGLFLCGCQRKSQKLSIIIYIRIFSSIFM